MPTTPKFRRKPTILTARPFTQADADGFIETDAKNATAEAWRAKALGKAQRMGKHTKPDEFAIIKVPYIQYRQSQWLAKPTDWLVTLESEETILVSDTEFRAYYEPINGPAIKLMGQTNG